MNDNKLFSDHRYTKLRANRSPREADLVKRLAVLDRRTCDLIFDSGALSKDVPSGAAPIIRSVFITPGDGLEDDFNKWYEEEHLDLVRLNALRSCPS